MLMMGSSSWIDPSKRLFLSIDVAPMGDVDDPYDLLIGDIEAPDALRFQLAPPCSAAFRGEVLKRRLERRRQGEPACGRGK